MSHIAEHATQFGAVDIALFRKAAEHVAKHFGGYVGSTIDGIDEGDGTAQWGGEKFTFTVRVPGFEQGMGVLFSRDGRPKLVADMLYVAEAPMFGRHVRSITGRAPSQDEEDVRRMLEDAGIENGSDMDDRSREGDFQEAAAKSERIFAGLEHALRKTYTTMAVSLALARAGFQTNETRSIGKGMVFKATRRGQKL